MMSWMLTATGVAMDLVRPEVPKVSLAHISHALAQINRFTGHAARPYSVAEHSLLVEGIFTRLFSPDVHGRMAALAHDAHEAYTGDMATPMKRVVGDGWAQFEGRMQATVRSAFALRGPSVTWAAFVHQADLIALATERAQLMPRTGPTWEVIQHVQPVTWVDLMSTERCAMRWTDWRDRFADEWDGLDCARNDRLFAVAQP